MTEWKASTLGALSDTTSLLGSSGKTTLLTVLVGRVADPVDTRIVADSLMLRIDKDHLKVLVGRILVDPVGVQDTKVSTTTSSTLLSDVTKRTLRLQVVDTLSTRLAVDNTLGVLSLTVTTTDADTVDDKSLLGLVTCRNRNRKDNRR